jgi:hypothetical protein
MFLCVHKERERTKKENRRTQKRVHATALCKGKIRVSDGRREGRGLGGGLKGDKEEVPTDILISMHTSRYYSVTQV